MEEMQMSGPDPFDVLRQVNPVDPDQLPDSDSPGGRELLETILGQPHRRSDRRWLPRVALRAPRRSRLIPAVAVLALALGAGAWALTRGVSEPLTIGCYAAPDLAAKTAVISADGRSPVDACREVWKAHEFGGRTTPPLAACVLHSGALGVFPDNGSTCNALGLPPVSSTYKANTTPAVQLKERLVEAFLNEKCLDEERARTLVKDEFDRLDLRGWRVETTAPFTTDRPCATLAFDLKQNTVLLVPGPRP
jgi:hypothetical protein